MTGATGQILRDAIVNESVTLNFEAANGGIFDFGHLHVAGPPWFDFSPMGAGRRENGPTMACLMTWAQAVRTKRPLIVIVENVVRFPISLIRSLFEDLYEVDWTHLEAASFGAPCKRKRLYCVLTLRRVVHLDRPLSDISSLVNTHFVTRTAWRYLFLPAWY